jgi:chromosome segregation ATPase
MRSQESIVKAAEDMRKLEDHLARAVEDQQQLQARVEELTVERDRQVEEAESLKSALGNLTAANQKLGFKIEENSIENKELEVKVVDIEKLRLEHEKKVLAMTKEIEAMRERAEKARDEATEYQSYLEQELETAKADVLDAANSLQELQDKYDWIEQEHQTLQNQNDELAGEKRLAVEELQSKLMELEEKASERLQDLATELGKAIENAAKSKQEAAEYSSFLEADLEKCKGDIVQAASDMERLEQELKDVSRDRDEKAEEIAKLQSSVEDLTKQVTSAKAAGRESAEYSSFLEADLEKSKGDIMQAAGDMERLEQELKDVSRDRDEKAAEIVKLQAAGRESAEYSSFLEADLEKCKGDIMQAAGDMERLEQELKDVSRDRDEKAEEIAKLESSVEDLKASAEKRQKEQEDYASFLEQEVETSKEDLMQAVHSLEELQSKLDFVSEEAEHDIQRHQEEIAQKDQELEFLQQKIASITEIAQHEKLIKVAENRHREQEARDSTEPCAFLNAEPVKALRAAVPPKAGANVGTMLFPSAPASANGSAAQKEQAEYTTFLESELQEAQNNLTEAQAILQRYQGEIAQKSADLEAVKQAREVKEKELAEYTRFLESELQEAQNNLFEAKDILTEKNDSLTMMQRMADSKSQAPTYSPAQPNYLTDLESRLAAAELQVAQTKAATEAKEKEQAEYTTFLESELQGAQNNLTEAQAILQRYQGEIAQKDGDLSRLQQGLIDIQDPGVGGQSTRISEAHSAEAQEAIQDLTKKLEKAQLKETEQAEYTTFLETELEEAQATAAEAGGGLAAAEEEIEKLSDELQRTKAAFHENVRKAEADAEHARSVIQNFEKENAVLRERIQNTNQLQENLLEQIQAAGTGGAAGLSSNSALDLKFLAEISSLKDQICILEESKVSLERRLEEVRRALEKAEASLGEAVKVANEAEADAAQLREQTMNALQERSLAAFARDNALKESERLRTDLDELKVKSQTAGALHDSETARKAAERDLELTRNELEQVRERINELEHAVSDLRSDQMESMQRNALLEKRLAPMQLRAEQAAEGLAEPSETPLNALADYSAGILATTNDEPDEIQSQRMHSAKPGGNLKAEQGAAASPASQAAALPDLSVQLTMTLGMSFHETGEEGSSRREAFKRDVANDLAKASGLPAENFKITKLSAGSVIVDIDILPDPLGIAPAPSDVARDLQKQAADPNSPLKSGKLTSQTKGIQVLSPQPSIEDADTLAPVTEAGGRGKKQTMLLHPTRSKPQQRGSANSKVAEIPKPRPLWAKASLVALCLLLGVVLAAFAGQFATGTSGDESKGLVEIKDELKTMVKLANLHQQDAKKCQSKLDAAAESCSRLTECQAKLSQHASNTSALQSEAVSLRKQLSSNAAEIESLREDIRSEKTKATKAEAEWRNKLDESVQSCKFAKSASQVVLFHIRLTFRKPLLCQRLCLPVRARSPCTSSFHPESFFALPTLLAHPNQEKEELKQQLNRVQDQLALNYKAPINESAVGLNGWWWGGTPQQIKAYREKQTQRARFLPRCVHAAPRRLLALAHFPPGLERFLQCFRPALTCSCHNSRLPCPRTSLCRRVWAAFV